MTLLRTPEVALGGSVAWELTVISGLLWSPLADGLGCSLAEFVQPEVSTTSMAMTAPDRNFNPRTSRRRKSYAAEPRPGKKFRVDSTGRDQIDILRPSHDRVAG
ncbi:hypothetical protein [Nakamurella lactea]|uniref:hypothetical protein n=1 Tax=Nakamurella lactea TaxID=459515 RepID=UPI0012B5AECC|nr:hypothetical protein [Nakamurella lactea]